MKRILVMEIEGGRAVLLAEDGGFYTVDAQPGWEVGMELDASCLELTLPGREETVKTEQTAVQGRVVALQRVKKWVIAAAACIVLLFGVQQGYRLLTTADASVEIAINPVVRIELNRLGRVIGLVGVNEDGKDLVQKVASSSADAEQALRLILNQAIADGYFSEEGKEVLIAVAGATAQRTQQLEKDMTDTANQVFTEQGIDSNISVRRQSFDTAQQMRAYIDSLVAQGMSLEDAYEQAGLGEDFLDLMGVRVHGDGAIELRFTQDFSLTGRETVAITPAGGESITAQLVEVKDDRFSVTAPGLAAGAVCTVTVSGMRDEQGAERSFTANFCNQKGRYARYEEAEDCQRLEYLSEGQFRIRFEQAQEGGSLTGQEQAVLLTREGGQLSCEIAGYEGGFWYLSATGLSRNELVTVAIANVQGKKGAQTLYGDCLVSQAQLPVIERTEFDAEENLVEVAFQEDLEWQASLSAVAVAADGTRISAEIVGQPDGDALQLRFDGLQAGERYQLEVMGSPFALTVSGSFIASDGAEWERD